jgi:hypothetical protein
MNLATIIEVDLTTNAHLALQKGPGWSEEVLKGLSPSFLMPLPSRYGQDPFLDNAIHCFAATASQMAGFPMKQHGPRCFTARPL